MRRLGGLSTDDAGLAKAKQTLRPLGAAVVGGLLFSQIVTLYLTPVFYTYMESFQGGLRRIFRKKGKQHVGAEEPQVMAPALASND